jgi:hypothetical protein
MLRTAKDKSDFLHTSGNMGMLESKTQNEISRLSTERARNVDVWKSTTKLQKLKNKIFED